MKISAISKLMLPQNVQHKEHPAYYFNTVSKGDSFEYSKNYQPSFNAKMPKPNIPVNSKLYWNLIAEGVVAVAGILYKQLIDNGMSDEIISQDDLIKNIHNSVQILTNPQKQTADDKLETKNNNVRRVNVNKTKKQDAPTSDVIEQNKSTRKNYERRTPEKDALAIDMKAKHATLLEIVQATNYSKATISRLLNEFKPKNIDEKYSQLDYESLMSRLNELSNEKIVYNNEYLSKLMFEFLDATENDVENLRKLNIILERIIINDIKVEDAIKLCEKENIQLSVRNDEVLDTKTVSDEVSSGIAPEKDQEYTDFLTGENLSEDELKNFVKEKYSKGQRGRYRVSIEDAKHCLEIVEKYNDMTAKEKTSLSKISKLFDSNMPGVQKKLLEKLVEKYNQIDTEIYNHPYNQIVTIAAEAKQKLWKIYKDMKVLTDFEAAASKKADMSGNAGVKFYGALSGQPKYSMELKIVGEKGHIRIYSTFPKDSRGNVRKKDIHGNTMQNFVFTKVEKQHQK